MIQRYVFLKLRDGAATPEVIDNIAGRAHADLPAVPGVQSVVVGRPADERSAAAWDLALAIAFDRQEDIEPYMSHPRHRAFVDEVLKPELEVIKAWDFAVDGDVG